MYHKIGKLHKYFFYLLILLLPTQLGRHFWPDWSFVSGIRLDYLSPTIYLTDIIIGGILLSWLYTKIKEQREKSKITKQNLKIFEFLSVFLLFAFLFLLLNVFLSAVPQLAFIKLLKLTELFLFALYIKKNFPISPARRSLGEGGQFRNFALLFSITILYSSLLAWLQFISQSSIGGIFWFLGERTFNVATPGIATAVLNGKMLLRPYATFPHPNVLAGYLTVLLPLLFFSLPQSNQQVPTSPPIFKKSPNRPARASHLGDFSLWRVKFLIFLSLATILITFSRTAWVTATLILFAALLYYKSKRVGYLITDRLSTNPLFVSLFFLFIILLSPLLFSHFRNLSTTNAQSLILRQELNQAAIRMIKNHPLTGVGLNNFLPQLPNYRPIKNFQDLQPAHNIYLLITAETGLVGLGMFLFLIFKAYQKLISKSEFLISNQIPITKSQIPKKKFAIGSFCIGNYLGQLGIRSIRNFPLLLSLSSILLLGLFDHYFFTLQQTQALFALILGLTFTLKRV